ncbi:polysaccharide pyruvyl transferase family protein [Chloroflexota bacterium]
MERDASKKGLNIVILHAPWNDRGDEAAVRAMIDSLRAQLPVKKMRVMIMRKNVTQFPYDDIDIVYPPALVPKNKGHLPLILIYLDALLMLFTFGKLSLSKQGRGFIKLVDEADVVIHACGGPCIGNFYGGKLLSDFPHLHRFLISKVFKNKPLFFYAPSMGPFLGRFRNLIRRFILKRADALIVREEISAGYLKEQLGLDSYVTADSALQSDVPEDYISRYTSISEILSIIESENVVGMTITDLKWHPIYGKYNGLGEKIVDSFLGLTQYLINKGYAILLIPQMFGGEPLDAPLLEDICKLVRGKMGQRIFVFPSEVDAYAQQVIISKLFCVISMRYHGSIFSAKGKVPFIAISYEHKIKGFVEQIELTDLMIDVEEISAEKIIDKFTYLEENYERIREQLKNKVPSLKEKARATTKIVLEKLQHQSEGK